MPTHDEEDRFLHEFATLSSAQRTLFLAAVRKMVEDPRAKRPLRKNLRVRAMEGYQGIYEMTWEMPDGRATFAFGKEIVPGEPHIIWRRIGGHEIYGEP